MPKHSLKICWFHIIWSTKNRIPFFQDKKKCVQVTKIIKNICLENNIYFKIGHINPEHIHILVDLPVDLTIKRMMQLIKGISSHTINESLMFKQKFSWARGYAAFSVSESQLDKVIHYIKNQDEHHRRMSFREEWELFCRKYLETVKTVKVATSKNPTR